MAWEHCKNNGFQGFGTPHKFQIWESVRSPEALQTLVFTTFLSTYLRLNLVFTTFPSTHLELNRVLPRSALETVGAKTLTRHPTLQLRVPPRAAPPRRGTSPRQVNFTVREPQPNHDFSHASDEGPTFLQRPTQS